MSEPSFKDFGKHWNKKRLREYYEKKYRDQAHPGTTEYGIAYNRGQIELLQKLCGRPDGYCLQCSDGGMVKPAQCSRCHGIDVNCDNYDGNDPCQYIERCPTCSPESEAN